MFKAKQAPKKKLKNKRHRIVLTQGVLIKGQKEERVLKKYIIL